MSERLIVDHEAALLAFAARCAELFGDGGVVYLEGELGMGKTTFARGVLLALGHLGAVKSPTYTLLEPYDLDRLTAYHFDLYRLADAEEMEYLGAREYFDAGKLCLVEWPQRAAGWLPVADLRVNIEVAGAGRSICVDSPSGRWRDRLEWLADFKY